MRRFIALDVEAHQAPHWAGAPLGQQCAATIEMAFVEIHQPVEAELDASRLGFRKALAAEFATLIAAAVAHLPEQDAALSAAALVGLLIEGLIGPLAPDATGRERAVVQSLALVALRALGVADARARGLVVMADNR